METMLTIITPTYNREQTLKKCFISLSKQSNNNFQWLIIDDGSTDNTIEVVEKMISSDKKFKIDYHYKENGGKHTALNFSHQFIKGDIVLILDSDDYLVNDAVKIIVKYWSKYKEDKKVCGLSFLKGENKVTYIGKEFTENEVKSDFISMRINKNIYGDKCEIIRTEVMKEYQFPVFQNERFLGEGYLWVNSAKKYDMVFLNEIIYICEYLDGGLTKSGRSMRIRNPLGGMCHAKAYFSGKISLKYRIKNYWLYICYGFFAKKSIYEIIKGSQNSMKIILNLPFGWGLYKYWKCKY